MIPHQFLQIGKIGIGLLSLQVFLIIAEKLGIIGVNVIGREKTGLKRVRCENMLRSRTDADYEPILNRILTKKKELDNL